MKKIASTESLHDAIHTLEQQHNYRGQQLNEKFQLAKENLKPSELLKGKDKDKDEDDGPPSLKDAALSLALGSVVGFVAKKIVVGRSASPSRMLLGTAVQLEVTKFFVSHPNAVKAIGNFVTEHVLGGKKKKK